MKEPLIEVNKHVVKTEDQHIQDFILRYKWPVKETGSGLRYYIYEDGNGQKAEINNIASLNYTLKSITGDIIYNSENEGILEFQIGKGQVPGGLEEGILLLRVGDKAKFIIPSHLGYGLLGDDNRIPPKSTLVYDLELFQLK
ncbi:FKBP-type peptidyl-prolyl cis-trans isomerase [Bacteroidota bacterium]